MPLVVNVRGEAGNQGNLRPADRDGAARAAAAWSRKAAEHAATHLPVIWEMRGSGMTLKETAWEMTARGFTTARGGPWTAVQVSVVLRRATVTAEEEIVLEAAG